MEDVVTHRRADTSMFRLAQFGVIGERSVEMAAPLREAGWQAATYYTGKRDRQYKRADAECIDVLDSAKPEDWEFVRGLVEHHG